MKRGYHLEAKHLFFENGLFIFIDILDPQLYEPIRLPLLERSEQPAFR